MKRVDEIMAELKALDTCGCDDYAGLAGQIEYTFQTIAEEVLTQVKRGIADDDACNKGTHYNAMDAYFQNERKLECSRYMFKVSSAMSKDDYERHCGITARCCFRIFNVATQKFVTDRRSDMSKVGDSIFKYICRISKLVGKIKLGNT
jgi:hypothetical protein